MERSQEEIVREKIILAEQNRVDWNKERVWQNLKIAKPEKTGSKSIYYAIASIAATLLVVFFAVDLFTEESVTTRLVSNKKIKPTQLEVKVATQPKLIASENKRLAPVAKHSPKKLLVKSRELQNVDKSLKPEPHSPAVIEATEPPIENLPEPSVAEVKQAPKPKKILKAIIGVIPDASENNTAESRAKNFIARFSFGQYTEKESLANNQEVKPFRTRIN